MFFFKSMKRKENNNLCQKRNQLYRLFLLPTFYFCTMTTRPNTNSRMNFAPSKRTFVKSVGDDDDDECQQIYKKLERLQPNGVCVNLETLRRALHPPLAIAKNRNEQILLLGSFYGQR